MIIARGKLFRVRDKEASEMRFMGRGIIVLTVGLLCSAATADVNGYELLSDWNSLPTGKNFSAGMASSYDRGGGNSDYSQYESPTGLQLNPVDPAVVLDVTGAGVLTRFWMPHYTANRSFDLRVYVDGSLAIDSDSKTYLSGEYGHAASPLVTTGAGGQVSYEPIGFSQSIRIETINRQLPADNSWHGDRHYYQHNYMLMPAGASVTPYTSPLSTEVAQARSAAASVLGSVGENPAGTSATAMTLNTVGQSIGAGESVSLVDLASGSGTIRRLNLKMDNPTDAGLQDLRVRIRYDGAAENAVDVPVGAFFGAASASAPVYKSLPMGTDSADGFYCYFPMPYRSGVQAELYNAGSEAVVIDGAAVEYESGAVAADAMYLHAAYNESDPGSGKHELLNVSGSGHYVGNILTLKAQDGDTNGLYRGILEGDDIITVNPGTAGEMVLYGTGLEDAYNGGYYYNHVAVIDENGSKKPVSDDSPFGGLLLMDTVSDYPEDDPTYPGKPDITTGIVQVSQYRWMIADLVPFEDGILVEVENYGSQSALYQSTAFYYQVPEPASMLLLCIGGAVLLRRRSRRAA